MRRRLLQVHRWTGLTAGLLIVTVALTGAGMVYRVQLEPLLSPALLRVPACAAPLPPDALVDAARAASPRAGPLTAIRWDGGARASIRLRFSDGRWIFLDPCSARVLGSQAMYGGTFGVLARLHIFGYVPFGEIVAGSLALLLAAVMALGGLALWWPASRRLLQSSWRLKPGLRGRAFDLNLHRTAALYAAPVLLASALSGLPQVFPWAARTIDLLSASAPQPKLPQSQPGQLAGPAAANRRLPLDGYWRQAQVHYPDMLKAQLRYPRTAADPVVLEVVGRGAAHPNALGYLYFDAYSGALLRHTPHAANSRGHKIYLWTVALHYGWIGGAAGQLALLLGALSVPLLVWTGTASYLRSRRKAGGQQRLRLAVRRKAEEAQGVCSFELVDPRGRPLPPFTAGAHIEVRIGAGLVRHYSLCNDPRETHRYRIAVLRCDDTRGGSQALHEQVKEGDIIETGVPRNHFPLAPGARHTLLLAGGIGITPILCMAERLAADGASFELHYCCRSEARAAFREQLRGAPYAARVHFHFSEGLQAGRLDLAALLAEPAPASHVYVCGPNRFMDSVSETAQRLGWPGEQVHREYFAGTAAGAATDTPFDIRVASSGRVLRVAAGATALGALADAGIILPSSCGQGVCGSCVTGVLEGVPEHRDQCLSAAEKAGNDRFTPCCSRARSPLLVLDL